MLGCTEGVIEMADNATKLVYVLPRVSIVSGDPQQKVVNVGKAQFWLDEDGIWSNVVHKNRPTWLDIYRDFPNSFTDAEPRVARGTLLISDDDEWLAAHVHTIIPLVYVLGLPLNHLSILPAEAFQYGGFHARDKADERVTFVTKNALNVEQADSLKLFPPIELRGGDHRYLVQIGDKADLDEMYNMMRFFRCSPSAKVLNLELVRRFNENPNDRIVMACYHLFRSQFGNDFTSPMHQDYAAYCASLEAALDIDGTRDVGANIAQRLVSLYPDFDGLDDWIRGLYAKRSIFVHGATQEVQKRYERVISEFHKRKNNPKRLRSLCLEVIHQSLWESLFRQNMEAARLQGAGYPDLRKMFSSDRLWESFASQFKQSIDAILAYSGEDEKTLIQICRDFVDAHDWRYMATDEQKVFKVLVAVAHMIHKLPVASEADKASASSLFQAADSKDINQVRSWMRQHYRTDWKCNHSDGNLLSQLKRSAFHAATFFESTDQN